MHMEETIKHFLDDSLTFSGDSQDSKLHVTLTFAQSVDAKIAGKGGKQLILSCKESMYMTHRLRSLHDAILVGIGTALNDNPQLNTRLLPPEDGGNKAPIPIILDSDLRFDTNSKLMMNFKSGKGKRPVIVTRQRHGISDDVWEAKRQTLVSLGVTVAEIQTESQGHLSIRALLQEIEGLGIRTLMVEGGASVISSFLSSGMVDRLIITVCPSLVGIDGIAYHVGQNASLEYMQSVKVGNDTVITWKCNVVN